MNSRGRFKDYYQILAIPYSATAEEIRAAYRNLARLYHPDITGHNLFELQMKRVNEAYHVLGNQERKRAYDARLYYYKRITRSPDPHPKPAKPQPRPVDIYPSTAPKRKTPQQPPPTERPRAREKKTAQPSEPPAVFGYSVLVGFSMWIVSLAMGANANPFKDIMVAAMMIGLTYYLVSSFRSLILKVFKRSN